PAAADGPRPGLRRDRRDPRLVAAQGEGGDPSRAAAAARGAREVHRRNDMRTCNDDALLALARGELPSSEAREVEEHAAECPACKHELAWLRAERSLFRAREAQLPSHVWQGIERRIIIAREERRERRRGWLRGGGVAVAFAAAASLLVFVWGRGLPLGRHASTVNSSGPAPSQQDQEREAPPASKVLDEAEQEYEAAIQKLQDDYESARD